MPMFVNEQAAEERSRLVLISFTSLSMRLMENWRQLIADISGQLPDYERTMILGAIITIGAEKLMRTEVDAELQTLANPFPTDSLTMCNVASIAAAVRLNRETVRRKVNELIEDRLVVREDDGSLRVGPTLLQMPIVRERLRTQLELMRRTANQLSKLDVLQVQPR